MIVVSLFDGMSCGQVALKELGYSVTKYYASEIDKHAMKQTMLNFPDTIQLGSVVDINPDELGFVNLLIGGSPCQSFSFAGKRKGMSTKDNIEILTLEHYLELKAAGFEFEGQSYLFWEYMRILTALRKINPNIKFLLENVEMGSKWQSVLSRAIGINPIKINSVLVSAQNRVRLYWTNIAAEPSGLFGDVECTIPQPKDRGILLKDILETEVDKKYFLSEKAVATIKKHGAYKHLENSKSNCILAGYHKNGGRDQQYVKIDKKGNLKSNQDKASCFTAGGNSGGNHSDMDLIVHNTMPRSSKTGKGGTGPLSRSDGKTYCLDTGKTNAVEIKAYGADYRTDEGFRVRKTEKSGTLCARARQDESTSLVYYNSTIRRLTPTECARLQTVPEWYKWQCSDTQQYRMLGNGWTIEVIKHILSFLN